MKNKLLLGLIGVLLVFGFVACDNGTTDTAKNGSPTKFEGTWIRTDSATLVFKDNTVNVANGTYVGTFTFNDSEIIFTKDGNEIIFDYTLSGNTLVLTGSSKNSGGGITGASQIQGTFTK